MFNRFSSFCRQKVLRNATNFGQKALVGATVTTAGVYYFSDHTAYAQGTRKVFAWGSGQYGQVGYGGERDVPAPFHIAGLDECDIVYISAGGQQSAALNSSGQVFTWGRSQDKRLGHGPSDGNNEGHPRIVEELLGENIVQIDAGFLHMGCVNDKGEVFTWGKNSSKQLGHKTGDYPMKVEGLEAFKVTQVACGRNHTLALTDEGEVYAWGGTKTGAQGTGKKGAEPKPTLVHAVADKKIVQITVGEDFSVFLDSNGQVYSCGAGDFGQTGSGRGSRYTLTPNHLHIIKKHKIIDIAAGQYHSVACSDEGVVFTWGFNKDGQLGMGDNFHRSTPSQVQLDPSAGKPTGVQAGSGHTAVIMDNGATAYIFGRGRSGQIGRAEEDESIAAYRALPVELNFFRNEAYRIQQIGLGSDHSMCLTAP